MSVLQPVSKHLLINNQLFSCLIKLKKVNCEQMLTFDHKLLFTVRTE